MAEQDLKRKISQLNESKELYGDEVVPMVQSGRTWKVTFNTLVNWIFRTFGLITSVETFNQLRTMQVRYRKGVFVTDESELTGFFLYKKTGVVDNVDVFPASDGGFWVRSEIGNVNIEAFNFKGNVETYADLAGLTDLSVNDGYGVVSDGLVYTWNGTSFPSEGKGIDLKLRATGSIQKGETDAVSGEKIEDLSSRGIGVGVIASRFIDFLETLKGTDRQDVSENSPWISGYINTSGTVSTSTSYISTRNFLPLKKGNYVTTLRIENETSVFAIYNSDYTLRQTIGSKGNPSATAEWQFEMISDGFIKFSYAKYYDVNTSVVKLEGRILTNSDTVYNPTGEVYVLSEELKDSVYSALELESTPIDTNFIYELTTSEITNTDLWAPRYLTATGTTANAENFYHTVKYYKIPKGMYEYRLFFSANAKGLIYDPTTLEIIQVLENPGADPHTKRITFDKDVLLRFSHRISVSSDRLSSLYFKNVEEIFPAIITESNINQFASTNSYRKVVKDSHKPRAKRKIVSLISDDGYASEYNWFCPLLEEYGIRATLAIVKNWVGNTVQGNMLTKEQVIDLSNRGHEIASHTTTHQRMDELTNEQLHDIIGGNKTYLEALTGRKCNTFISPFGIRGANIDSIVSAYHDCNVISGFGSLNSPPLDSFFLNRVSFDLGTGQTERFPDILKPIIDSSADDNNWLLFAFHTARGEYGSRQQELRNMIEYLLSIGYEFMTVDGAMNYMRNPVEIGVKRFDPYYYKLGMDGTEENVGYFEED